MPSYTLSPQPEKWSVLLKQSLGLYKNTIIRAFSLSLILALSAFIPRFLSLLVGENVFSTLPPLSPERLWLLASDTLNILLFSALLLRIHEANLNPGGTPWGEAVKTAVKKAPAILIALVILWIFFASLNLSFFGLHTFLKHQDFLSFSGPGRLAVSALLTAELFLVVYLSMLIFFYLPLIIIENKSVLSAIRYSASLVYGHWWRTFLLQLVPWFAYFICLLIARYLIGITVHIYFFTPQPHSLFTTAVNILLFALLAPWAASLMLVQLHDLELRKKEPRAA